ncbi:hypothetical protein LR48_Vigan11g027900 [Vigna angularis]|uniref:Uncharacterized protein n=1 Tax=Phaseolus angularis TaxID=3914 RepID=A0A0L9VQU4_PHAAN|nr:hypothetical protein LR48_Vigan11g027900 [Vigna angularis]
MCDDGGRNGGSETRHQERSGGETRRRRHIGDGRQIWASLVAVKRSAKLRLLAKNRADAGAVWCPDWRVWCGARSGSVAPVQRSVDRLWQNNQICVDGLRQNNQICVHGRTTRSASTVVTSLVELVAEEGSAMVDKASGGGASMVAAVIVVVVVVRLRFFYRSCFGFCIWFQ